jgi:flagellar basal body-associated protein FliL
VKRTWVARKMGRGAFAQIITIIAVIAVVIIAALVLTLVFSNNPSNQNGVPGTTNDTNNSTSNSTSNATLLPGQASAQVIVTIHSTHSIFHVHYVLYLNSDQKAEGDIAAHSSTIQTITLVWPEDQTGLFSAVVLATSSGGGFGDKSNQAIITPVNNGTYPVTLNV